MPKSIAASSDNIKALQQLISHQKYIGKIKDSEFILKRNFGARRLLIVGKKVGNRFEVKIKNEVAHQFLLVIFSLVLLIISIVLFINKQWIYGLIILPILGLIYVEDNYRKNKEFGLLQKNLYKIASTVKHSI